MFNTKNVYQCTYKIMKIFFLCQVFLFLFWNQISLQRIETKHVKRAAAFNTRAFVRPCSISALRFGLKATSSKSPWHTLRVMAVRVKEKPEVSIFNRTSTTSGNSLY